MTPSVDSPTVVVGVGGSGIDIVNRVHDAVREEGYEEDEFLFYGIDSREIKNIEGIDRWDQQTATLSWKERKEWKTKFREYNFLDESDDIPPEEGGVQRDRPLARALIDDESNINQVIGGLRYSITNFEERFNSNTLDIWVVNSLGGGTGSGMLPMTLGLMQWLEQSEFDSNINLHAIASLPQLDLEADAQFLPTIDSRAVPNSFAALTELRDLLDVEAVDTQSVSIDLQHDTSKVDLFKGLESDRAPIQRDHLEAVYLMGIDEETISQDSGSYAEQIERLASNTILAHAVAEENFPDPDDPSLEDRILHTNDFVELRFPYETAADFVKVKAQDITLGDDKEALDNLKEQYESNRDFVNEAITVQEDSENAQITSLYAYCQNRISDIDENTFRRLDEKGLKDRISENISIESDEAENLRTEFNQARNHRASVSEDRQPAAPGSWTEDDDSDSDEDSDDDEGRSPEETVLLHFGYLAAKNRARQLQSEAQLEFETALDDLWNEIRDDLDDGTVEDYRSFDSSEDQWKVVASDAVSRRIKDLREGGIIRTFDEEADELAELRDDVERAKTRREDFESVTETLEDLSDNTLGNLRNLVEWYNDSIESIDDTISRIEGRRTTLEREYEEKREMLCSASHEGSKYATMALTDPDALIDEYFTDTNSGIIDRLEDLTNEYGESDVDDDLDQYRVAAEAYLRENVSLSEYDTKDIIDGDELYERARSLVANIEERVADEGTMTDGIVLPMEHPEDDWLDVMGEDDYEALITGVTGDVANCDISSERGYSGDRGTIRFLFSNPNVTLDDCSEYSTLSQWYDDETLLNVLETEAETPEEAVNFAYPELVNFLSGGG